ncbi:hypothetical protein DV738_g4461, partial [Chaetothyriales sp. CBS 135597]
MREAFYLVESRSDRDNMVILGMPLIGERKSVDTGTRVPFVWGDEQEQAMYELKIALTTPPALITLDYGPEAGPIVLAFDAIPGGSPDWREKAIAEEKECRASISRIEGSRAEKEKELPVAKSTETREFERIVELTDSEARDIEERNLARPSTRPPVRSKLSTITAVKALLGDPWLRMVTVPWSLDCGCLKYNMPTVKAEQRYYAKYQNPGDSTAFRHLDLNLKVE